MATVLKDKFGREHNYLRLSLMDKCNLRCTYCMPEKMSFLPQKKLMTASEIQHISNLFVREFGINKIRLTGGEPLLRSDFNQILEGLSALPVALHLTTNGVYLDKHLTTLVDAGMKSVNISLDSLDEKKFKALTKRDGFSKILKNIQLALAAGLKVKLNVVAIKGVVEEEVLNFIALTKNENIHVRFIEFMPFNGNQWEPSKVVPYQLLLEKIGNAFEIEKLQDQKNSTGKKYKVVGHQGSFSFITTVTQPFCSTCNRIRLTADGKLKNCLFSAHELDILTPHRNGLDIQDLMIQNIQAKKEKLGGLPNFETEKAKVNQFNSRPMVGIGG